MTTENKKLLIAFLAVTLVTAGIVGWMLKGQSSPGKLDTFAVCLEEEGATFYGAFWCSHCQSQKALFGSSKDLLPYVECSTPDANDQTAECDAVEIKSYPTWDFAGGERVTGELSLEELSEKTGCPLPE